MTIKRGDREKKHINKNHAICSFALASCCAGGFFLFCRKQIYNCYNLAFKHSGLTQFSLLSNYNIATVKHLEKS